jgi:Flp pilus assembly protein TadG
MTPRTGWRNRKGQAAVELALVLPVFLLLVVGMLEFARAWNLHQTITDAVREGARRALIADTPPAPVDSVYAPMWRYLEAAGYQARYATMGVCNVGNTNCGGVVYPTPPAAESDFKKSGERVTVVLSVPFRFFILGNRPITMKSSITVRNE